MARNRKSGQRIEPRFDGAAAKPEVRTTREGGAKKGQRGGDTARRRKGGKAAGRGLLFRLVRGGVYWSLVMGLWATIAVTGIIAYYGVKLPSSTSWSIPDRPPNARIVSEDGKLIANRGVTGGEAMRLEEMSPYLPLAVIAIEDRRFKSHFGIDPVGLARAMATNLLSGRLMQGGSTLTQQLAKNLFLEPERTLERKVQEVILAIWLESRFSKDEILELYLNRVYFGSGAYGVDAAARRYFNKSARDVSLSEAATLAGLLKAPSKLSPARNPELAEERAQLVLAAMRREGFVSDSEVAAALSMPARKARRYWSGAEHYAADMVMKELPSLIGEMREDVIVDTTIDFGLEKSAEELVRFAITESGEKLNVHQGALVSLDGTGAIRAIVGGYDYADSQFNRAIDARRQPGSAFKPIVYLAALEAGRTPETVRVDRPVRIGKWEPENYDRKYRGPVTLSEALSQSLNTIAAQLISETGTKTVIDTAARLGIASPIGRNASIALGTSEVTLMELTAAYATFANGGFQTRPFLIRRVMTAEGKVLYERNPGPMPRIVNSRELGMMNAMLRRVVEEGTGKAAQVAGWEVAGKTGTTQGFRDALFVGYTANLVTGIWFGNDDGEATGKVTGGSLPARVFGEFMQSAHRGVPVASLPGHYAPENPAVTSTAATREGGIASDRIAEAGNGRDGGNRGPVPGGEVGGGNPGTGRKPKGILELLFGG